MSSVNILVSGWFGCGNAGDDAILEGTAKTIRSLGVPAEMAVLTYDSGSPPQVPGTTVHPHLPSGPVRGTLSLLDGSLSRTMSAFRWADIFLLGGGGFLSDWQGEAPWLWLRQLALAKFLKKRTMVFGVGAGPFSTGKGKCLSRNLIDRFADRVTVRDERSKEWLHDIGIKKEVFVSGDPSLSLSLEGNEGGRLLDGLHPPGVPVVGINVIPIFSTKAWGRRTDRHERMTRWVADTVSFIIDDLGCRVLGIPFMDTDRYFMQEIASDLAREEFTVLPREVPPLTLLSSYGQFKAFLGMRYHSLLFSCLAATPFYGIIYNHKGKELVKTVGVEEFSQEIGDGVQAGNRDLDYPSVKDGLQRLIAVSDEVKKHIGTGTTRLVKRERANSEILGSMAQSVMARSMAEGKS